MRKNIKKFAGIVLCIGMFTGCAQTPDSSLVKPKGSKAVDAYTEADDVSGSKGEASESKNDDGSESKITIRNLIDAPQNYKSHVEDDSAKLVVNTDASVEIPEVEKVSAISVTAAEVTQELLDRITNAFFSEAKLYTIDSYYVKTKDEIKKTLDELKEDVANGNLDPYNYGTDDDGNYVYDIYEDIETWEQEYETAPEKKTLTEAKPVAGNYFNCVAQMPDDSQYYYIISFDGSDTLLVKIKKAANKDGEKIPEDAMWCDYGYSEEEEKPTEESIGLSLDEAKKLVKEKVEKMGITDLQFSNWNYAVCKSFEDDNSSGNFGNGYRIDYARTINGVPVTQTIADGGALEDMDSTMETWSYESLCFYVDKDGIESMTYSNPYTIGKIKTENLNLLSFSEVMKIYEKMMVVTNADNMQYENSRVYNIDRIVLGYARIYEPSTDAHTGILIPVWDFFGSMTSESEYNGETESNTSKDPNESFLTINAVDGSIIRNPKVVFIFLLEFVLSFLLTGRIMVVMETYDTPVQAIEPFIWTFGWDSSTVQFAALASYVF